MFDILIVGGGPVGACAGALLARGTRGAAGLSVALLEPRPPRTIAADAGPDPRVVALSRASERLLKRTGSWAQIPPARLSAYERMRIWHESIRPSSSAVLVFDAADVGEPNLGYIAENRALQVALLAAFAEAGGHLEPEPLTALSIGGEHVQVSTPRGTLTARLVVGADGAQSAVRAAAGLSIETRAYRQTAIVANVASDRPHQATAWQRFMRDGTLAFLPLADGTSSIVWSADESRAAQLLSFPDAGFAQELDRASDLALGGQGVNLGLLDAAALAQQITSAVAAREDPGALRVLRTYERWRKSELAGMALAIDAFDRLLAYGAGPVARLAQRGLSWVNRSQELRRFFIYRALGMSGELPDAAR